jgi:hypothetical protein
MIVSKYGKSYDTSDGSEQSCEEPARRGQSGGWASGQRWEDDGGPVGHPPAAGTGEFTSRPSWSTQSLADLNESIRREHRADDPARVRQEAERAQRDRVKAAHLAEDRTAAAARARRDRYRNAWENT